VTVRQRYWNGSRNIPARRSIFRVPVRGHDQFDPGRGEIQLEVTRRMVSMTALSVREVPSMSEERVSLHPGESRTVSLPGLRAGGYIWTPQVEGDEEAVTVDPIESEGAAEAAPGANLDEVFVVRAQHPGKALVRFVQRRPWEVDKPAMNEHLLELSIE
jgi:hypothetical protein